MNRYLISFLIFIAIPCTLVAQPNDGQIETRCGWFANPSPGNISLYDKDSEWIISVQGGYQVESDWDWPAFSPKQWIETNVHYGYGCACLQIKADHEMHQISLIKGSQAKPLKTCRQDRTLARWQELFQ